MEVGIKMILSCQDIKYAYTVDDILKGVSFHINKGEQTAIVGVNGAGKTTLFKILTAQLSADSGNIFIKNDTTLGYLEQQFEYNSDFSVYDELYIANQQVLTLKDKISDYEKLLDDHDHPSRETLVDYHHAIETFEALGGYGYDSLVKGVLKGLGFVEEQFNQQVTSLSGGQKTRLALGKLLIKQPDLLLLDEPTNHLDLDAIRWLEGYLSSYKGTLLIVSHDRYFLDRIVSKVVDIEQGKAVVYKGNYSSFIQKKEFTQQVAEKHFEQQQSEIKRQEEIIRKLRSYGNEKFIKRAQSREKALDKKDPLDKPTQFKPNMNLALNPKRESGIDVLRIKELSMGFDNSPLFTDLNLDIYKGDKIALIGNNGTGKTTLFRILMGELKATSGKYKLGSSVELAYYDQQHEGLSDELTLVEEIAEVFPDMGISKIRNLLASFLFTGDDAFKEVKTLSGGEKGRLSLAKLMLSGGNFLLLDEPTNHLDMISKEVLENALRHYSGTIFFISHDRYFINRVATKVLELTPNGTSLYHGNYDYYLEKKSMETDQSTPLETTVATINKKEWLSQKEDQKKENQLANQIHKSEEIIEDLESQIAFIDNELTKEDVFKDYELSQQYMLEKAELEDKLEVTMEEWEALAKEQLS
jgi:ATP-binding cassette subfamily F protein 3